MCCAYGRHRYVWTEQVDASRLPHQYAYDYWQVRGQATAQQLHGAIAAGPPQDYNWAALPAGLAQPQVIIYVFVDEPLFVLLFSALIHSPVCFLSISRVCLLPLCVLFERANSKQCAGNRPLWGGGGLWSCLCLEVKTSLKSAGYAHHCRTRLFGCDCDLLTYSL